MVIDLTELPADALAVLVEAVEKREQKLPGDDHGGYVGSNLIAANRALSRIQAEGLARGPVFCEWGSGLGGVCGVAALNGFLPHGIEIQGKLVTSARSLAEDLNLPMTFAEGTFLRPGDESSISGMTHTGLAYDCSAWDQLNLLPDECDLVFAYPWPGEEASFDDLFARHASPGALFLTFHGEDHLLLQRKLAEKDVPQVLGWF